MPPFNANESILTFEAPSLAPDTFNVVGFRGEEAISRPFRFELDLSSSDPDVLASDVVAEKATLTVGTRAVNGVVAEFEYLGSTAGGEHAYRAVLVPRLWLLSLRFDSQIFFALTPPDLIRKVLEEGGLSGPAVKFDLGGSYTEREFYTQYTETDLDFVQRIAEHHGIAYRFEHADGEDTVVFFDQSPNVPPIGDERDLRFEPDGSLQEPGASVVYFTSREHLVTGQVMVKDYNYRTPETALLSESNIRPESPGLYYEYGTHHKDKAEGDRIALVRNQEIEAGRRTFRGRSAHVQVQPGYALTISNHVRSSLNADYLVTEVRSRGDHRFHIGMADTPEAHVYENEFVCIPLAVTYRPPRVTPVPKVPGIMTARIESAGGDYAYLDEEGRYRAKMHFDLSDASGGEATRPIRMNQPYSGPGYGIHFPNHADTEIIWACVNGDPDRPLALGTSPNPSNGSPVTSANKAHNTIRTMGQNELTMDDTIGRENIYMHATYDHHVVVNHDEDFQIHNNRTITVGGNHTEQIRGNMSLTVDRNVDVAIKETYTEEVLMSKQITVGTSETHTVGATLDLTVGAALSETVGGAKVETVGGLKSETVGGVKTESVGGIKTENVGANRSLTVGGNVAETIGGNVAVKVGKDVARQVLGKQADEVAKDYTLKAKKVQVTAEDELTLKCGGAEITLKKNGDVTIKGKKINVKGSGDVVVKGSKIAQN